MKIIAEGKVEAFKDEWGSGFIVTHHDKYDRPEIFFFLGQWAKKYVGQTITISLKEENVKGQDSPNL